MIDMTIDETIAHAREKAEEIRENIIDGDNLEPYESYCNAMVAKSAEEQEQLAEWLEELKKYKEYEFSVLKEDGQLLYKQGILDGYDKAVDDFVNACKEIKEMDLSIPQHFTKEQSVWIKAYCIKRNIEFYNKAIDDCKELTFREVVYYDSLNDRTEFRELAEQLKAGGKNE